MKHTKDYDVNIFSKEEQVMERRREPRLDLNIHLSLGVHQWTGEGAYQGQVIEGKLINLSENGIRLVAAVPLALDMFVVIRMPDDAELPTINARIIRVEPLEDGYEYGCMLLGTPAFVRKQLESYIQNQLESHS
jgi:hypothetical protein